MLVVRTTATCSRKGGYHAAQKQSTVCNGSGMWWMRAQSYDCQWE